MFGYILDMKGWTSDGWLNAFDILINNVDLFKDLLCYGKLS